MADVFNKRFQEMSVAITNTSVLIRPLTIMHVSDLEMAAGYLSKKPQRLWELLKFNHRDKKFVPAFYQTLAAKKVRDKKDYKNVIAKINKILDEGHFA